MIFEREWSSFVNGFRSVTTAKILEPDSKSVKFAKKLGFNKNFTTAMALHRGVKLKGFTLDWYYAWENRKNRVYEISPNMLPIGQFDENQFIYLLDIRDEQTSVICKDEKNKVIFIMADDLKSFMDTILKYVQDNKQSQNKSIFDKYIEGSGLYTCHLKIQENKFFISKNSEADLKVNELSQSKINGRRVLLDFSNAQIGSGVSLNYFGNETRNFAYHEPEIVLLEDYNETKDIETKIKKDKISNIYTILGVITYFAIMIYLGVHFLIIFLILIGFGFALSFIMSMYIDYIKKYPRL